MSPGDALTLLEKVPAPVWGLIWKAIVKALAGKPDEAATHIRAAAIRVAAKKAIRLPLRKASR